MVLYEIFRGISMSLQLISYALLIYCILTWVLPPQNKVMQVLNRFIQPLLWPIRNLMFRLFPRLPLDLSPLLLMFLLRIVEQLLWRLFYMLI